MKKLFVFTVLCGLFITSAFPIAPFFKLAEKSLPIKTVSNEIITALKQSDFEVLGSYGIGNKSDKMVIVFTNDAIKQIALGYPDRGGLAIAQKISLIYKNGKTTVSLLNPIYMFNAYFQKSFGNQQAQLTAQVDSIKLVFEKLNYTLTPYGGDLRATDLHDYQYMIGMPEFTDPVKLNNFESFEVGLATIRKNLKMDSKNTISVYEFVSKDKQVAVFGVGLPDTENGEPSFLSIIGEDHLAAMPYEIILQGNIATMLHGRYRFALYWPELTMSTFTKIMSTPGYVEETLEFLCK